MSPLTLGHLLFLLLQLCLLSDPRIFPLLAFVLPVWPCSPVIPHRSSLTLGLGAQARDVNTCNTQGILRHIHTRTHTHTRTHIRTRTHTSAHTHTHTRTHTHAHAHTHTRTHAHTHAHAHTHTQAHTLVHSRSSSTDLAPEGPRAVPDALPSAHALTWSATFHPSSSSHASPFLSPSSSASSPPPA